MDRSNYIEESFLTIPLMEGKTIKRIFTTGSFEHVREVVGLRIQFSDDTEVHINTPEPDMFIDVSRGRGLYPA